MSGRHQAQRTWKTLRAERAAKRAEHRAERDGVPVPPGKGRHRRWAPYERIEVTWNYLRTSLFGPS